MNKKLFSWKALAGLTLLVAMGLTSCKQGAEVDPNDPYNVTKPVTPGIIDSKTADLTIAIGVPSDFLKFWNKVDADTKNALAKKSELNILIKSQGMKLSEKASAATRTLTLPDFFNGKDGKIVNVTMTGAFGETKNPLIINSTALAKDLVYLTLPGNNEESLYSVDFNAGTSIPVLQSAEGTLIDKLNVTGDNGKNALKVGSGITAARITNTSTAVTIDGGTIETLMLDYSVSTGYGVKYTAEDTKGTVTIPWWPTNKNYNNGIALPAGNGSVYGVWATGNIDVYAMSSAQPLSSVVIEEGNTVWLYGPEYGWKGWGNADVAPFVKQIIGLGNTGANVIIPGWPNGTCLTNTELVKNVTIQSGINVDSDIYEGVTFNNWVDISEGLSTFTGNKFNGAVWVVAPSTNYEFTFSGSNFASGIAVDAGLSGNIATKAVTDANDEDAFIITYRYYNYKTKSWTDAAGNYYDVDNISDIPAQNKKVDPNGGYANNYYQAWQIANEENAHTWYAFVEYLSEDVDEWNVVLNFSSCKVDGKAMTNNNLTKILAVPGTKAAVAGRQHVKYRIGDVLFKWKWTTGGAKLVSTKE
jgi:hypothetical protein